MVPPLEWYPHWIGTRIVPEMMPEFLHKNATQSCSRNGSRNSTENDIQTTTVTQTLRYLELVVGTQNIKEVPKNLTNLLLQQIQTFFNFEPTLIHSPSGNLIDCLISK